HERRRARRAAAAHLPADRSAQPGAGAHRARAGPHHRSAASGPLAAGLLQQPRAHPEPHRPLAAAVPAHLLLPLHGLAAGGVGDLVLPRLLLLLLLHHRLPDEAVPPAVVRHDHQPAQPDPVRRELGRRGDRRAHGLDRVPAARAALLRRRAPGQPARPPRREARRARRGGAAARYAPDHLAGGAGAAPADRRHLLVQLRAQDRPHLARRDRRPLRALAGADRHRVRALGADASAVLRHQAPDRGDAGDRVVGGFPGPDAAVLALDPLHRGAAAHRHAREHRAPGEPRDLLGGDARLPAVSVHRGAVEPAPAPGPGGRARTVFYDVDCGACWAIVRVLARMDVWKRLRWVPNTDTAALPPGIDPALLDRTMLVFDP